MKPGLHLHSPLGVTLELDGQEVRQTSAPVKSPNEEKQNNESTININLAFIESPKNVISLTVL